MKPKRKGEATWYDLIVLVNRLKKDRPLITRKTMLSLVDAYYPEEKPEEGGKRG